MGVRACHLPSTALPPIGKEPEKTELGLHWPAVLVRIRAAGDIQRDMNLGNGRTERQRTEVKAEECARAGVLLVGPGDEGRAAEIGVRVIFKEGSVSRGTQRDLRGKALDHCAGKSQQTSR